MTEPSWEPRSSIAGQRVVEVSAFVAAPYAGMVLAQLGADVIRVDPIAGPPDEGRWPVASDGTSYFWAGLNRGKRAVRLDTRSPKGAELFHALLAGGGTGTTLLTNVPIAGRLGGMPGLHERHPLLNVLEMTGNADGSSEVDYTVQPSTGIPFVTGHPSEGTPLNSSLPAWDLMLGLYAVIAIVDAVHRRDAEETGQFMSMALSDVAFSTVANVGRLGAAAAGVPVEDRAGNDLQGGYGQAFRTSDNRWVMVVGLTDRQWKALIGAIDPDSKVRTALAAAEADVTTAIGRYLNRQLITALIQPWFNSRSLKDVQGVLDGAKASWSIHRTFSEVLDDPRVDPALNDLWSEVDHPTLGRMRMPGSPIRRGGRVIAPAAASPLPGQDSEDVLVSVLGLSSTEVATLIDEGVVL